MHRSQRMMTTLLRTATSGEVSSSRARAGTHALATFSFCKQSFPTSHNRYKNLLNEYSFNICKQYRICYQFADVLEVKVPEQHRPREGHAQGRRATPPQERTCSRRSQGPRATPPQGRTCSRRSQGPRATPPQGRTCSRSSSNTAPGEDML